MKTIELFEKNMESYLCRFLKMQLDYLFAFSYIIEKDELTKNDIKELHELFDSLGWFTYMSLSCKLFVKYNEEHMSSIESKFTRNVMRYSINNTIKNLREEIKKESYVILTNDEDVSKSSRFDEQFWLLDLK